MLVTREPGGTEIAEEIRKILLHTQTEILQPQTELLLMFAGRSQHIQNCIVPALQKGQWVISDRYIDASYAYQGGGRGIDSEQIKMLDQFIVGQTYPDLTILLDLPVELGMTRAENRGVEKDRIEQEKFDFFNRVRHKYLERAKADSERIKVIAASQSLAVVQMHAHTILDEFLRKNHGS